MKVNKSLLAVLSMFLILLVFVSSASAADANTTDVLSVDESVNLENNTLALDAASNDNNAVENDEILQNPNSDDVLGIKLINLDLPEEITVGEEFSFSYETDMDVNRLSINFKDTEYHWDNLENKGTLSYTYDGEMRGPHQLLFVFKNNESDQDWVYRWVTIKGSEPKDAEIIIDNDTISLDVGATAPTGASVKPSEAGTLKYQSNDTNVAEIDYDEFDNPIITGVNAGTAKITVSLIPNPGYKEATPKYIYITVNDEPTPSINVVAENLTKYYNGPERFVVIVTDASGVPIINKTVTMTINGVSYPRVTDNNGIASLGINLPSGNYTASVTVDSITVNATVTVLPTIVGQDITSETRNVTYVASLVDNTGNPLENGTPVEFDINGIIYQGKVIGDEGKATVDLILNSGNYTITATNPKTKEKHSNKLTINAKNISIEAEAEPITVGEDATVIVIGFIDADGNVATGNITVTAGGKTFNGTVDDTGVAKIIVTGLTETTTADVNYLGDEFFNPANTTVEIIVNPNPDRKNLTLNATSEPIIAGENATIIVTGFENATGDVTARIDGGLLSTTIVNGTATFNVPGLTLNTTAYISYGGNDEYNAASTWR